MVVGAFPAAKLGALLLKQISKPIANTLKNQAKQHPVFRKYVCMPPAQFYNWCEVKAKMWVLNLGKPVNIPVLNEAMAIELGANLLGEGIIFIIAAGILISEYNRSSRKEAAKEDAKREEMNQLQNTIRELFIQSEEQGAHIRELTRKIADLDTKLYHHSNKSASKPKSESPRTSREEPPPPPPPPPRLDIPEKIPIEEPPKIYKNAGLILNAISALEYEFFGEPKRYREDGIVTLSLNHVYYNVFRLPA